MFLATYDKQKTTMSLTPILHDISDVVAWKKHLDEEGYAVISTILSGDEYQTAFDLFKKDWNEVSPRFDFEDKTTWGIENAPLMYGKGMAVFNGFGQSDFMWYLRTLPQFKDVFKKIHDTDELVTSMDGFSVYLSNKQKSKSWLHVDQNPKNPLYSIQGAYNFRPVGEDDAGFVVVPRSHVEHTPDVAHDKSWIMCPGDEHLNGSKKLLIPENCFTLWNSKTIHANKGMTKKTTEFNRLTAYLCYLPKSIRTPETLDAKIQAYISAETTSHWANKCELKKYPFGFGKRYEERGYNKIVPRMDGDDIPADRLDLL